MEGKFIGEERTRFVAISCDIMDDLKNVLIAHGQASNLNHEYPVKDSPRTDLPG